MKSKNNYIQKAELNINSVLISFWQHKLWFLLSFIISILASLFYFYSFTPIYKSFSILEIVEKEGSSLDSALSNNVSDLLNISMPSNEGDISITILGDEFLEKVLKLKTLKTWIDLYCEYSGPSAYSLTSILNNLGIGVIPNPSEKQLVVIKLKCLRDFISISGVKDKDNKFAINVFKLITETENPNFSATLANEIVDMYINSERDRKAETFEKSNLYISNQIAKSKIRLSNYQADLDNFIVSQISLLSRNSSENFLSEKTYDQSSQSILNDIIKLKLFSLGNSEQLEQDIYNVKKVLQNFDANNLGAVIEYISNDDLPDFISKKFVSEILGVVASDITKSETQKTMVSKVKMEIKRLNALVKATEERMKRKQEDLEKLLEVSEELTEKQFLVVSEKQFFAQLNKQLSVISLKQGNELLNNSIVHSKASPPIYSTTKKSLVLAGFMLSFLIATAFYVTFKILLRGPVFSLNDMKHIPFIAHFCFLSISNSMKRDPSNIRNLSMPFDVEAEQDIENSVGICAIIDLSNKNSFGKMDLSDFASRIVGAMSSENQSVLMCLNEREASFESDWPDINKADMKKQDNEGSLDPNGVVIQKNMQEKMKSISDLDAFLESAKKFNKTVLSVPNSTSERLKSQILKISDFFILVGKSGSFSIDDVMRYNDRGKKCLGFMLVK